jgi:hypothetical protein
VSNGTDAGEMQADSVGATSRGTVSDVLRTRQRTRSTARFDLDRAVRRGSEVAGAVGCSSFPCEGDLVNSSRPPYGLIVSLVLGVAGIASCSDTPDDIFGDGGSGGGTTTAGRQGTGATVGVAGALSAAGRGGGSLGSGGDAAGAAGADGGSAGAPASGGSSGGASKGGASGGTSKGGSAGGASEGGGASGASTSGAAGAEQGGVGMGGSSPGCPANCDPNADCTEAGGTPTCACRSGFVGDGEFCRRPNSCNELHESEPALPSGAHVLEGNVTDVEFEAYCEMSAEGGGWTLILNEGPSFDPTTSGTADVLCYVTSCTSLAYSEVLLRSDVMIDMSDTPIAARVNYAARAIITGVHPGTRDKTLRTMFAGGSHYLEAEDNSNLTVRVPSNEPCDSVVYADMAAMICTSCPQGIPCDAPVLVFGDQDSSCDPDQAVPFAIGGASDYSSPWTNCAGWPQLPDLDQNYYPDYMRVWIR